MATAYELQSCAHVQGVVMLLCVMAFDWPAEAAKAVQGALQHSSEDAPAVQPLLYADVASDEGSRAASAHASSGSHAPCSTMTSDR